MNDDSKAITVYHFSVYTGLREKNLYDLMLPYRRIWEVPKILGCIYVDQLRGCHIN